MPSTNVKTTGLTLKMVVFRLIPAGEVAATHTFV